MPTYTLTVTVSTRVANLVRDAALRTETSLTARDWFVEQIRHRAVQIARNEKEAQDSEAASADFASLDTEVTT